MSELKVGDPAPDFEAQNQEGETVRLSDLRGRRVVLYFYPKDNTPGCTTQACGFRDQYPAFGEKNTVVLGVSTDNARSHQRFRERYNLPFPLLVDSDHQLAEQFGVWRQKKLAGHTYMGIVRSHFVIDEQGRLADVRYDVKAAQSSELALDALS